MLKFYNIQQWGWKGVEGPGNGDGKEMRERRNDDIDLEGNTI